MSRTRRIWFKKRFKGKFIHVENRYVSDKKHVSCVRKERYIRKEYRHKIRAQNRCNRAHKRFAFMIANTNETSYTEYFD